MNILLLFLTILITPRVWATNDPYFLGQVGYLKLTQEAAVENNVSPVGTSFAGGVGFRKEFFEIEALFLKASGEDDLVHDGQDNKMIHQQSSLIFAVNFYLTSSFYARVGYGLHRIHQELDKPVSEASQTGADKAYGLVDKDTSEGLILGGGLVLLNGRNIALFTQIEKYQYTSIKSGAWNASLGFRFYIH